MNTIAIKDYILANYDSSIIQESLEKMKNIGSRVAEKVPQTSVNNPTTN